MNKLQIIRTQELSELLSVSKQTIWRLSKSGELPPKVKIGDRAVGWRMSDIETYLEEQTETKEVA